MSPSKSILCSCLLQIGGNNSLYFVKIVLIESSKSSYNRWADPKSDFPLHFNHVLLIDLLDEPHESSIQFPFSTSNSLIITIVVAYGS